MSSLRAVVDVAAHQLIAWPGMANFKAEFRYGYQESWLNQLIELYNKTEMKRADAAKVNRAFRNSQVVASAWNEGRLVAIGRALTDFEMYASIFDLVVDPEFQRSGLGKKIMEALLAKVPGTCVHLTSTFGNESFYGKQGFRFHRTAMALYPESFGKSRYLDWDRKP